MKSGFESFKESFSSDFPASIVVFFVAVPLCLGIAMASGAPLYSGLIAGVVGGIVVGLISRSALGVSGPAAGLTVIVLSAINQLGSFEIFLLAVVLAGLIQVILGILKAGVIGYYFPSSVIKGMLTAIGIIIILKQIPHVFGYDKDYEGDLSFIQADGENTFSEIVRMMDSISPGAIAISIISLTILFLWDIHLTKKYPIFKLIQGPLIAVIVGIVYEATTTAYFPQWALGEQHLVNVPVSASVVEFFGQFTFPTFSAITDFKVWSIAITIAIVASLESLLSVEATDKLDPYNRNTDTSRELIAQGCGNMVSGFIGGLPVTQVILRSSANIHSGAKTRMSAVMHGVFLLLCVVFIPQVLNRVPLAVLACILLVIGFKLASPSVFKQTAKLGWTQFVPFMATIIGVVFTDLLVGIGIGFCVSIIIVLRDSYYNSHFLHRETSGDKEKIKLTLAEQVVFLNKGRIKKELSEVEEGAHVTIDMQKSVKVDYDVLEIIEEFTHAAKSKNISVELIKENGKNKAINNINEPSALEVENW